MSVSQGVKFTRIIGDEVYGNSSQVIAGIEALDSPDLWMRRVQLRLGRRNLTKDKAETVKALVERPFADQSRVLL